MRKDDVTLSYWFYQACITFSKNATRAVIPSVFLSACGLLAKLGLDHCVGHVFFYRILWTWFNPVLGVGGAFYWLKLVRGETPTVKDLLSGVLHFWTVWLTSLIASVIVIVGTFLLIVPGIIWLLKYGLSMVAVLDRRVSPIEAIRFSGKITLGYKRKLFVLLLLGLIFIALQLPLYHGWSSRLNWASTFMIVSMICYSTSMLVVGPFIGLASASAYDQLSRRYN